MKNRHPRDTAEKISIKSNKKQNKVIKITTAYRIKSCVGRKK